MHGNDWLTALHNAHHATLLKLAQNRLRAATGSTADAEDVVQDVYLLAAEKDIRDVPNPLGWLIKTTCILCMKRVDQAVRERNKAQRFIQDKLDMSADRSVYAVERTESETDILLWLLLLEQTLSPADWDILRKYCILGVPIEDIAAQTGAPINRLKVKIHRTRKKLDKIRRDV